MLGFIKMVSQNTYLKLLKNLIYLIDGHLGNKLTSWPVAHLVDTHKFAEVQ